MEHTCQHAYHQRFLQHPRYSMTMGHLIGLQYYNLFENINIEFYSVPNCNYPSFMLNQYKFIDESHILHIPRNLDQSRSTLQNPTLLKATARGEVLRVRIPPRLHTHRRVKLNRSGRKDTSTRLHKQQLESLFRQLTA